MVKLTPCGLPAMGQVVAQWHGWWPGTRRVQQGHPAWAGGSSATFPVCLCRGNSDFLFFSLPFLSAWPLLGAGSACRTRCAAGEPAGALFVLATAVFNRHLRAPRFFHAPAHSSGAEAPFLGPGDGNEHCPSRFSFPALKDLGGTKDSRC